jgi:hypothetical protein
MRINDVCTTNMEKMDCAELDRAAPEASLEASLLWMKLSAHSWELLEELEAAVVRSTLSLAAVAGKRTTLEEARAKKSLYESLLKKPLAEQKKSSRSPI